MAKEKPQLSQKQQYQRLTQAKAQALRNGQETPKLDRKIEKLRTLMGSAVQKSPPANRLPVNMRITKESTNAPCRVVL